MLFHFLLLFLEVQLFLQYWSISFLYFSLQNHVDAVDIFRQRWAICVEVIFLFLCSLVSIYMFKSMQFKTELFYLQRLIAKYGSLVSVLLLVGTFIYMIVSPSSKSSAAKGSKKKRWFEIQSWLSLRLVFCFVWTFEKTSSSTFQFLLCLSS